MPNDKEAGPAPGRRRLKLIVAYDGTRFAGWQSQAHGETVQDQLEAALAQVLKEKVRVHGAGRTDAGVHALGQSAHVDLATKLAPAVVQSALNALLPPDIRVLRCRPAPRAFHARFSARGKVYRYRIATTPVRSPFEIGRAWHVSGPLDDACLRAAAREFLGRHDFTGFVANRGHPVTSTTRTMRRVRVRRTRTITELEFEGDGFLYKMVRLMVGAIVRCARGKMSLDEVRARLAGGPAESIRLVAPGGGLTLVRVLY